MADLASSAAPPPSSTGDERWRIANALIDAGGHDGTKSADGSDELIRRGCCKGFSLDEGLICLPCMLNKFQNKITNLAVSSNGVA
uniref:Uncharacterized protein n=1 Tax=Oryza barthii TaxID=65489 RepID=A0A0D3FTW1_9ORYZ